VLVGAARLAFFATRLDGAAAAGRLAAQEVAPLVGGASRRVATVAFLPHYRSVEAQKRQKHQPGADDRPAPAETALHTQEQVQPPPARAAGEAQQGVRPPQPPGP